MITRRLLIAIFPHIIITTPILSVWAFILIANKDHEHIIIGWMIWIVFGAYFGLIRPFSFYFNYYLNDRKMKVDFNNSRKEFYFTYKGKEKVISFDDILYLDEVYDRIYLAHFLRPYYYRLITKNKEVFFFSRLWVTRLDKKIDFTVGKYDVVFPYMRKGF